jgi:hypothetical protein
MALGLHLSLHGVGTALPAPRALPPLRTTARSSVEATAATLTDSLAVPSAYHRAAGLLAQSPVTRMGSRFRGEQQAPGFGTYIWILLVPILSAAGIVAFVQHRQRRAPRSETPQKLLRQLCREHQLSQQQARLLKIMAEQAGLANPAALMVRPDQFERAVATLRETAAENVSPTIDALRDRLFAGESEQAEERSGEGQTTPLR